MSGLHGMADAEGAKECSKFLCSHNHFVEVVGMGAKKTREVKKKKL